MLTIRLQRTGRTGRANFRVVVQDSRWSPKSGRVVARLGHYDPHTKTTVIVKEKAEFYLKNGAQPSDRVAKLLKDQGVKLPGWVKPPTKKQGKPKHPEKFQKDEKTASKAGETTSESEGDEAKNEKPAEEKDDSVETSADADDKSAKNDEGEAPAETEEEPEAEKKQAESKNEQ